MLKKIKVWEFQHPSWGIAFKVISNMLHKYSPDWVEWVDKKEVADISIVHIVGAGEKDIPDVNSVIIQHCYFTASHHEVDYVSLWEKALLTISFHNLPDYTEKKFNFFRSPWGADENTYISFNKGIRRTKVFTTGHIADTECIDKVYEACKIIDGKMLHTGNDFKWAYPYNFKPYMPLQQLVFELNNSEYVAGLRLIEGFEIMCVEGLFCGARPIVPKLPSYELYENHAEYINPDDNIVEQLAVILKDKPRIIEAKEYAEIINKFSWKNVIGNIFKKIEESIK